MTPDPIPMAEAVSDAVFEQPDALPTEPPDLGPTLARIPTLPEPPGKDPTARPSPTSPLRDYLRELKQEFDEQEDEGKL